MLMFPSEILVAYLAAVLLVVIAPGPDNILAIGRGLSQGRAAAVRAGGLARRRFLKKPRSGGRRRESLSAILFCLTFGRHCQKRNVALF